MPNKCQCNIPIGWLNELDYLYGIQYQVWHGQHFLNQERYFIDIKKRLKKIPEHALKEHPTIKKVFEQLDFSITYYKNHIYRNIAYLRLNVAPIAISELLAKLASSLNPLALDEKVEVSVNTTLKSICCDSEQIIQLLVRSLNDLQKQSIELPITLSLQDTTLCYPIEVVSNQHYKKIIPAIGFMLSTTQNHVTLQTTYTVPIFEISMPENITELTRYKNKRIIDAHYGYSEIIPTELQMGYIIPVDLQAIRPKIIDPLSKNPLETSTSIAVEASFLSKLQKKQN